MLPPRPPSPPDGPPRGTYFSLRNATHPFPPSPAFTEIFASSTNILHSSLRTLRNLRVLRAKNSSLYLPVQDHLRPSFHPKRKNGPDSRRGRSNAFELSSRPLLLPPPVSR